ncbi:tRNA(Ile)(2)-agmatinylcytidine synthase [Halopenitus persicus]|uniref:tRNA(Ile2) 2-agmatinylcytidine synthetase TiaS n=1 Tax=Halopenitus persicus TaxID=1048396 RepID=A0A1H3GAV1_9EURY|nr:tRNA(Ile)(2)-agmatinylcytidine synthase [Halopenitus persicus]SDY00396.1 tRNA(Ile2) 2-agmatinylcytidine synthetase [Halopenitus persicus]
MTIVGLDDTDSRSRGMCTTYLATRVAERIEATDARVHRRLLVRLNPAVKHKTRGNAALALHTDLDPDRALEIATAAIREWSIGEDPRTSPGVVVADVSPDVGADAGPDPAAEADAVPGATDEANAIPEPIAEFARGALRRRYDLSDAISLIDEYDLHHAGFAAEGCPVEGRGRIGALAAVGAAAAFEEWTHEHIVYREFDRCGTPRSVDHDSVFTAADAGYPTVWDTVDRGTDAAVCVPNAPGPILYGIRGDDPDACRAVAERIDSEPVDRAATFLTNQGTDAHLRTGEIGSLRTGAGYRVDCVVATAPETRRGGHVFLELAAPGTSAGAKTGAKTEAETEAEADDARDRLLAAAFAPTERFRDRVRALRPGDRITVCGEVATGREADATAPERTIKLEKFAVRELVRTERVTPTCPDCGRSMSSAGRGQGYRCRDCGTAASGKETRRIDRDLEPGWYEVPPCARRHVAKPLVRGGFDAPVHPEQ